MAKRKVDPVAAKVMRDAGMTWREIGERFGVTPEATRVAVRKETDQDYAETRRLQVKLAARRYYGSTRVNRCGECDLPGHNSQTCARVTALREARNADSLNVRGGV